MAFYEKVEFYILPIFILELDILTTGTHMVKYELMMIVDPTITEVERTEKIDAVKVILDNAECKIINEDVWGEKKLAYKINKQEKAYYLLYTVELDGTKIATISKEMNLNRSIWRYMFVKIED